MDDMLPCFYGRYSSGHQRETSIEDQYRLGCARAEREGWHKPALFADQEISARTPTVTRPGGLKLLEALRSGRFNVLLIESLDRCWRDIVDQESTIREIEQLGVRIIGVSDGYDSEREGRELQRVIIGGVNQQFLRDLGKKTHRGLTGQAARGYHAGGLAYGYRTTVVGTDAKGEAIGHRLEIDEEQAQWVRWIFIQYAAGWAPRRIVYELNRLGITSPRGGTWAISAIYGQPKYGTGILRNDLYRGVYVWNRSRWVRRFAAAGQKAPRKRIERPETEWSRREAPELRIVPAELWEAVHARLGSRQNKPGKPARAALSGLLRCGGCGGSVVAVDARNYGCAARKDRGPAVCDGVIVRRAHLDRTVLAVIREQFASPEALAEFRAEASRLLRAEQHDVEQAKTRKRLAGLDQEISRLVDAVAASGWSEALSSRLKAAETDRAALRADLSASKGRPTIAMIPRLVDDYRAMLDDLPQTIAEDPEEGRKILRDLVGEIRLIREPDDSVLAEMPKYHALLNMVAGAGFYNKKQVFRRRVA